MPENENIPPRQEPESLEGRGRQVGGVGRRRGRPVFVQPGDGLRIEDNGDVTLRIMARPGDNVEAFVGNGFRDVQAEKMVDEKGNGLFSARIPRGRLVGPQRIRYSVNGVDKLNVMAPMLYFANSLSNYVEFPDPETDGLILADPDIPHGSVSHVFFWSKTYSRMMSSVVYTPPGCPESGPYPVLYFVHECGENTLAWTDAARTNYLFDNLIASGQCVPFIMVEVDCTMSLGYHDEPDFFGGFSELETYLLEDCRGYIESHLPVRQDKWSRAIAGIGLGAAQAGYIGLRNTDIYGSVGVFTAFWTSAEFHDNGKEDPIYDAVAQLGRNPDALRVFYRAEGDADMHYKLMGKENELFERLGVTKIPGHCFRIHKGMVHAWGSYRRSFRDFVPMIFPSEK